MKTLIDFRAGQQVNKKEYKTIKEFGLTVLSDEEKNTLIKSDMDKRDLGWLQSSFHFSFSEYYNSHNILFG